MTLFTILIVIFFIAIVLFYIKNNTGENKSSYSNISVQELTPFLSKKNVELIDVRTSAEMKGGVIGKPQHMEFNASFKKNAHHLDKEKTYVLYCRSGRRSAMASGILSRLGFKNIYNLKGGFMAWQNR